MSSVNTLLFKTTLFKTTLFNTSLFKTFLSKLFVRPSNISMLQIAASVLIIITFTAESSARTIEALEMKINASKLIIDDKGKTVYIPVSTAEPGALIQYKASYTNKAEIPLKNTIVTIPIPANTEFTGDAYPPSAQASIDYHNYMDIPLKRLKNGLLTEIPFSEYKSLRWEIRYIPPHKSVNVAFNTIVK